MCVENVIASIYEKPAPIADRAHGPDCLGYLFVSSAIASHRYIVGPLARVLYQVVHGNYR